jgi:hypothetical protein
MLENVVCVWVFRGTASDRRTGFIEMSDANARNAIVGGRAQDPMLGAPLLNHIDYTVAEPDPPLEDGAAKRSSRAKARG